MKHIRLLGVAAAFAAVTLTGFATPPTYGPVNFKLTSIQQHLNGEPPIYSTNRSSTFTNYTSTSPYTTATSNINNGELLTMLANSFGAIWPAGAELRMDGSDNFYVVTNSVVIQNVSSVFYLSNMNNNAYAVYSGSQVNKDLIKQTGPSIQTESIKFTETVPTVLIYDDSALLTGDGTTTQFMANGLEIVHGMSSDSSISGSTSSQVLSFVGTGPGTNFVSGVSGHSFIVGGTVTASGPLNF